VERLAVLVNEVGVADRVHLPGHVPHEALPDWYRDASVVACTPRVATFGMTAIEAMACGVPVVAYPIGGLADSVVDRVTGVLATDNEPGALAAALRAMLADESTRLSSGSAGVDRARSRYPWERTAAEVERVYAEVTDSSVDQDSLVR
jgi:glycosyltransferase involved in cell wall biosynthesis